MYAAGVIVKCSGLVLLAKRIEYYKGHKVKFGGYWSIFAGSREPPSDPPMVCAVRELYEEAGIKIKTNRLKFVSNKEIYDM